MMESMDRNNSMGSGASKISSIMGKSRKSGKIGPVEKQRTLDGRIQKSKDKGARIGSD